MLTRNAVLTSDLGAQLPMPACPRKTAAQNKTSSGVKRRMLALNSAVIHHKSNALSSTNVSTLKISMNTDFNTTLLLEIAAKDKVAATLMMKPGWKTSKSVVLKTPRDVVLKVLPTAQLKTPVPPPQPAVRPMVTFGAMKNVLPPRLTAAQSPLPIANV